MAFINRDSALTIINGAGLEANTSRRFYFGRESLFFGFPNLFYSKTSYLKESINRKILLAHDMGLRNYIQMKSRLRGDIKLKIKSVKEPEEPLLIKFKHFKGGLYSYGIGILVAFVCFIGEFFYKCYKGKYPKLVKVKEFVEEIVDD